MNATAGRRLVIGNSNGKALAVAMSFVMALAACGGGGGGSSDLVMDAIQAAPTMKEIPFDATAASCPATSHPFSTMLCSIGDSTNADGSINYNADGSKHIDLGAYGYTEKEFFQSGAANIYDLDPATQRAVLRSGGNPYTTRLLVRYPKDPAKFSGRVYVEILNASNNYDIENTWRRSWQYMMGKGDAFVGITSKAVTANALKKFDAIRYADINWKVNGADENGLFWDMLSQLAIHLRQPDVKILGSLKPRYVYLTGESQSGFYMNTYLTAFSDRVERAGPNGTPLFDGYLNGVGPGFTFLRSESAPPYVSVPTNLWQPTKVPHIVYMGEGESRFYDNLKDGVPGLFPPILPYTRRADSDLPADKFRFYEYAGSTHTDPISKVLPINSEIVKAGGAARSKPAYYFDPTTGIQQEHNDLQLTEFVHAMWESVHSWAAAGTPAPAASPNWMLYNVTTSSTGQPLYDPKRDALGNALGAVRSPLIEAPLYRFYGNGQTGVDAAGKPTYNIGSWGSMGKLPDATVNGLYGGSCATYLGKFNAAADAAVAGRYLNQADADAMKAWAIVKGNLVVWTDGRKCN